MWADRSDQRAVVRCSAGTAAWEHYPCKKLLPQATNTNWKESSELQNENLEALFKRWLSEHGGTVLKVARAYTLTTEDCQDLAQEILLEVWRSLPQFQGRASAFTWCYRVALNTALAGTAKNTAARYAKDRFLKLNTSRSLSSKEIAAGAGPGIFEQFNSANDAVASR
jgi:hypothetical protein